MSNLDYRGNKSSTYLFAIWCALAGTALVLVDKLTGEWVALITVLVGLLAGKQVGQSAAEAYRDRESSQVDNPDE